MGEMSDYYLEQEDPFDPQETYWRGEEQPLDGPPYNQQPRPTTTTWVTRDGQRVPVSDMTDAHLVNTIRYLRRSANASITDEIQSGYSLLGTLQGEMAIDCVERDLQFLEETADADAYLEDNCPTWPALLVEAEKRGLKVEV